MHRYFDITCALERAPRDLSTLIDPVLEAANPLFHFALAQALLTTDQSVRARAVDALQVDALEDIELELRRDALEWYANERGSTDRDSGARS